MQINIAAQGFTAATVTAALVAGTEVTFSEGFGATYGLTITPANGGYTVTDTTGGDQDAATVAEALSIAAEFIADLTDDTQWVAAAEALTA